MNCFLYAKLIRDAISAGLGGAILFLLVKFRWYIIGAIITVLVFTFGWIGGVPKTVRAPRYRGRDDVPLPWEFAYHHTWGFWRRLRHVNVPTWLPKTILAVVLTPLLLTVIALLGVALYHRYWIC